MVFNIGNMDKRGMKMKSIKREDGFTLLEVILAITILSVGLLAVGSMQASAIRANSMSNDYTASTDKVQDFAEKMYSLNFNTITDRTGDGTAGLDDTGADADYTDASNPVNPKYTVYWNVAANMAGGTAMTGVNTVRIIVTWQERGVTKSRSFDFLRTRL